MDIEKNSWSFNAPQYVDFAAPQPVDDDADKWFDLNEDGEALHQIPLDCEEMENNNTKGTKLSDCKENIIPESSNTKTGDTLEKKAKLPNILCPTEWNRKKSGGSDNKPAASTSGTAQRVLKSAPPTRQSPRLNEGKNTMKKGNSMSNLARPARRSSIEGNRKSLRKESSQSKLKRSSSLRTKIPSATVESKPPQHQRGLSSDRVFDKVTQVTNKKPKITMPTTPKFMKRRNASVGSPRVVKNSEEQELEKIAELQKQMVLRRKQAEESLRKMKEGGACVPVIKNRGNGVKLTETKPQNKLKGFFSSLKDKMSSNSASTKEEEGKKSQRKPSAEDKFESMAERIVNFHKSTPDRFHTKAKDKCKGLKRLRSSSKSPHKVKLTMPQTPNLQCTRRTRPVHAPSRQELEEKELEEMQKNQFHARPVNHRIFEQTTGLKRVARKPGTEVECFSLSSDRRIKDRETKPKEEEKYVFQAQPVNAKILEGVVGVKPAKERPATIPQSPAFALKNRVRLPVEIPEEKREPTIKARAVPHHGIPFQPTITRKTTVIQPFSFETRNKQRSADKEAKIQQVYDDEQKEAVVRILRSRPIPHVGVPFNPKLTHKHTIAEPFSFEEQIKSMENRRQAKRQKVFHEEKKAREFHAQPMPHLDEPVGIPEKQLKDSTTPVPFDFEVDYRSTRKADETSSREEDMIAEHVFKAKPLTVIYQEPFIPRKSTKPLTDVSDFELFTERRAAERESFEMYKKHREAELEAQKRQREFEQQEAEKETIARERQERVPKANPIRNFAAVKIQHSDKPLTKAESPQFSDRFKI